MHKIILILAIALTLEAKNIHKERVYQKIFCDKVRGKMEYRLPDKTRVDCQTSTYSFEVDFGRNGLKGVGQALYYAMMSDKKAGLVLIQENRSDNRYISRLKKLCKKYNSKLFVINKKFEIRVVK